jgi:hypothetical protein
MIVAMACHRALDGDGGAVLEIRSTASAERI